MSIDLFWIRMFWISGRGGVRYFQKWACLLKRPELEAVEYEEIDFAPEADTRIIRPPFEGWRDMRANEVDAAIRYLIGL